MPYPSCLLSSTSIGSVTGRRGCGYQYRSGRQDTPEFPKNDRAFQQPAGDKSVRHHIPCPVMFRHEGREERSSRGHHDGAAYIGIRFRRLPAIGTGRRCGFRGARSRHLFAFPCARSTRGREAERSRALRKPSSALQDGRCSRETFVRIDS